jgi:hypothetical protein
MEIPSPHLTALPSLSSAGKAVKTHMPARGRRQPGQYLLHVENLDECHSDKLEDIVGDYRADARSQEPGAANLAHCGRMSRVKAGSRLPVR